MNGQTVSIVVALVRSKLSTSGDELMHLRGGPKTAVQGSWSWSETSVRGTRPSQQATSWCPELQPGTAQPSASGGKMTHHAPKWLRHSSNVCAGPAAGAAGFANTATINMYYSQAAARKRPVRSSGKESHATSGENGGEWRDEDEAFWRRRRRAATRRETRGSSSSSSGSQQATSRQPPAASRQPPAACSQQPAASSQQPAASR